jgi:uncharacterized phiE125 gp8 family phage protein
MRVTVITPPASLITIAEARKHLVDLPQEDEEYVKILIAGASSWIDGPNTWLARPLGVQVLEAQFSEWPCAWAELPYGPVLELISITYVDPAGDSQSYPVEDPFVINMPAVRGRMGDVRIRYRAGYGSKDTNDATKWIDDVPAPIKVAVMMLVAQWYRTREPIVIGATVEALPFAVEALLQPYRIFK